MTSRPSRRLAVLRLVMLGGGLSVAAAGVFAYPLGLSASKGLSSGKVVLVCLGLLVAVCAGLGRRTLPLYRAAAVLLLNTLVLLAGAEVGLLFLARAADFLPGSKQAAAVIPTQTVSIETEQLPYYRQKDWGRTYWREYHQIAGPAPRLYAPYVTWKPRPFKGKTINIDDEGRRYTTDSSCGPDAYRVWVLGGSTIWGTGTPDWGTIPSLLQAELSPFIARPLCVVNLGVESYVSTQELILLLLRLLPGEQPDLVIFYDGINDVFAAYQSGLAGVHQNLDAIRARFENRPEHPPFLRLVSRLRIYRAAQHWMSANGRLLAQPTRISADDVPNLARDVVEHVLAVYRLVSDLAEQRGFRVHFFVQPMLLVEEKALTVEESRLSEIANSLYPQLSSLCQRAYRILAASSDDHPDLTYLGDVFRDIHDFIYVDPWHVTVEGNSLIAKRMADSLQRTGALDD